MTAAETTSIELAPSELGADAVCGPVVRAGGAATDAAVALEARAADASAGVPGGGDGLELFDGLKRARAACELSWPTLRVDVHAVDSAGAKVRLLRCNAVAGLSELEEGWLVRSLYREDLLTQPQIAVLLGRHKSWVCRRLTLAEELSDELTASVRLGLVSATAVRELVRLPRGNQDAAARVVARRGLTTRQTARLVDSLRVAPQEKWPRLLEDASRPAPPPPRGGPPRRTPGEQLVADASAMKGLTARLHARLLERSLQSLGEAAGAVVSRELAELRLALIALTKTLDSRLTAPGGTVGCFD